MLLSQIKCLNILLRHKYTHGDICAKHSLRHWSYFYSCHAPDTALRCFISSTPWRVLSFGREPLLHFYPKSAVTRFTSGLLALIYIMDCCGLFMLWTQGINNYGIGMHQNCVWFCYSPTIIRLMANAIPRPSFFRPLPVKSGRSIWARESNNSTNRLNKYMIYRMVPFPMTFSDA